MRQWLAVACLLGALTLAGCVIDFDADVPCESTADCPSGMVCNEDFLRCVEGDPRDTSEDTGEERDTDVERDIEQDPDTIEDTEVPDTTPDGSGDVDPDADVDEDIEDTEVDVPECVPTGDEICDGVDNDCDGAIDEDGVCDGPCAVGMIQIDVGDGSPFCIDIFEASRSDATATSAGADETAATSRPGVLPWGGVPFDAASAACTAAGKRLCSAFEWQKACAGPSNLLYPYSSTYDGSACNGSNVPPIDAPAATGTFEECVGDYGIFDLSGNLFEWTSDNNVRGGAYDSPRQSMNCSSRADQTEGDDLPQFGFRCCAASE